MVPVRPGIKTRGLFKQVKTVVFEICILSSRVSTRKVWYLTFHWLYLCKVEFSLQSILYLVCPMQKNTAFPLKVMRLWNFAPTTRKITLVSLNFNFYCVMCLIMLMYIHMSQNRCSILKTLQTHTHTNTLPSCAQQISEETLSHVATVTVLTSAASLNETANLHVR